MALIDFQTALGRAIREQDGSQVRRGLHLSSGEQSLLETVTESAGFRFTVSIQRSWCIGRAAKAAHLTLSLLPEKERQHLLDAWADSGAGTRSFYSAEADAFLDFIASQLPDPSHQLTICQFERATLRASSGAEYFEVPDPCKLPSPACLLRQGAYAGLVRFYADPNELLETLLQNKAAPPLAAEVMTMLFGPGLPQLCRPASVEEVRLWERLVMSASVKALLSEGYCLKTCEALLAAGAAEYAADPDSPAAAS